MLRGPIDSIALMQEITTAEGTTVEELATKALERDLARRWSASLATGRPGAGI